MALRHSVILLRKDPKEWRKRIMLTSLSYTRAGAEKYSRPRYGRERNKRHHGTKGEQKEICGSGKGKRSLIAEARLQINRLLYYPFSRNRSCKSSWNDSDSRFTQKILYFAINKNVFSYRIHIISLLYKDMNSALPIPETSILQIQSVSLGSWSLVDVVQLPTPDQKSADFCIISFREIASANVVKIIQFRVSHRRLCCRNRQKYSDRILLVQVVVV